MPIRANPVLLIVRLPAMIVAFWLIEGPTKIATLMWIIIRSTANILSVPILIKTFFRPWKGEYRKGYVAIARGIGIIIRLFTLLIGLFITLIVVVLGAAFLLSWVLAPIAWTVLLIISLGVKV